MTTPDLIASLAWAAGLTLVGVAWAVAWAARSPITVNVTVRRED